MSGEVPVGWTRTTLAALADITRGVSWRDENETSKATAGALPVLGIRNVQQSLKLDETVWLAGLSQKAIASSTVRSGDILMVGSNGNPARIGNAVRIDVPGIYLYASLLFGVRPDEKQVDGEFLFHLIRSSAVQQAISDTVQGSTGLANLKITVLRDIPILLPEIDEQRRIPAPRSKPEGPQSEPASAGRGSPPAALPSPPRDEAQRSPWRSVHRERVSRRGGIRSCWHPDTAREEVVGDIRLRPLKHPQLARFLGHGLVRGVENLLHPRLLRQRRNRHQDRICPILVQFRLCRSGYERRYVRKGQPLFGKSNVEHSGRPIDMGVVVNPRFPGRNESDRGRFRYQVCAIFREKKERLIEQVVTHPVDDARGTVVGDVTPHLRSVFLFDGPSLGIQILKT